MCVFKHRLLLLIPCAEDPWHKSVAYLCVKATLVDERGRGEHEEEGRTVRIGHGDGSSYMDRITSPKVYRISGESSPKHETESPPELSIKKRSNNTRLVHHGDIRRRFSDAPAFWSGDYSQNLFQTPPQFGGVVPTISPKSEDKDGEAGREAYLPRKRLGRISVTSSLVGDESMCPVRGAGKDMVGVNKRFGGCADISALLTICSALD
ncbi:hypothetical protein B0H19DRAFT_1233277 [Mycena capillaripes]|nr:hypothetical protein B0H19DRAFT_1233277 [Mycena capillaripes]